jgi:hypothetical protein
LSVHKLIATAFVAAALTFSPQHAKTDHMPLIYPDGAVVYGDWGLYRPGAIVPFVEGPYVFAAPRYGTGYFPTNRYDPGAYRSPPAKRPIPAEPWFQSWGAQSDSTPATIYAPYEGPSVIYAPNFDGRTHEKNPAGRPHDKK